MSLIENAIYGLLNGKKTIIKPIFIKDFEKENQLLTDLQTLSARVTSTKKKYIDRDIMLLRRGIDGEQNVYFELKNSFIPMLCLHDIRIEYKDYAAQLDFVIITTKFIMVLETKKLSGDIEINKDGDFIRLIKNSSGRIVKKEGMYSPISQNERHVNILREMLIDLKLIKLAPIKSAVVIADPKSILNKSYAPKSIQQNIYKYDQISNLIKNEYAKVSEVNMLENRMYDIANFLLNNNRNITMNLISKYSLVDSDFCINQDVDFSKQSTQETAIASDIKTNINKDNTIENECDTNMMIEVLKKYRLETSRKESIKPYFIFNNEEMENLIEINPKTKEELLKVKGFGPKKLEKYGEDILNILKNYEIAVKV